MPDISNLTQLQRDYSVAVAQSRAAFEQMEKARIRLSAAVLRKSGIEPNVTVVQDLVTKNLMVADLLVDERSATGVVWLLLNKDGSVGRKTAPDAPIVTRSGVDLSTMRTFFKIVGVISLDGKFTET